MTNGNIEDDNSVFFLQYLKLRKTRSDSDYIESYDSVELNSNKSKLLSIITRDLRWPLTSTNPLDLLANGHANGKRDGNGFI